MMWSASIRIGNGTDSSEANESIGDSVPVITRGMNDITTTSISRAQWSNALERSQHPLYLLWSEPDARMTERVPLAMLSNPMPGFMHHRPITVSDALPTEVITYFFSTINLDNNAIDNYDRMI